MAKERGFRKKCTRCGKSFRTSNMDGVKLVNGTECPSCEAQTRVIELMDHYRALNAQL